MEDEVIGTVSLSFYLVLECADNTTGLVYTAKDRHPTTGEILDYE